MAFLEGGYPVWKAKQEMLNGCDFGELPFFGDSKLDSAVIPSRLPFPAANLAFAGATPLESYFFVKRSMACAARPRQIVLSFGSGAFSVVQTWLWENAIRYDVLGWNELLDIRSTAKKVNDEYFFNVKTHDGLSGSLRDFLYLAHFPSVYFNSLVEARFFQREERNMARFIEARKARGYFSYRGGEGAAPFAGEIEFNPLPIQRYYFEKMVELLDSQNISIEFALVPVSSFRYAEKEKENMGNYLKYIHGIEEKYHNFHVLQTDVPIWPNEMFADGAHLNARGAEKYSDLISRCLKRSTELVGRIDGIAPCNLAID